ncbi:MAG: flagellar basal body rod protein FlgB [Pacificimonas sp.]
MTGIDAYLGEGAKALSVHAQRLDLIASNIANAATPGFKARDIDFADALKATTSSSAPLRTDPRHLSTTNSDSLATEAAYRVPHQASLDGNTVELGTEQVAFAENAVRYETTLSILGGRIKTLMSAIKGE